MAQCFVETPTAIASYLRRIGNPNLRALYRDNTFLGGLAQIPMGQWFHGRRIPMTGIAAVAIAPECRNQGAAITLMQHTVEDLFEQGTVLSVLYPAVQRLYRQVGYEQGGSYCGWQIESDRIDITKPVLPVEPVALTNKELQQVYNQQAPRHSGHLDRHPYFWQRLQPEAGDGPVYAYRLGAAENPQGYVIFEQKRLPQGTCLEIKDWAVLTQAATQTLWALLASHRSIVKTIRWQSGPIDLLTLTLPEQPATPRFADRWLLRIINLPQALTLRGYPTGLDAELHLAVTDEHLPANTGRYVLSVTQGQGHVKLGGHGALQLTSASLAPLYSGLFSATQLYYAGYLEGDESTRAIADQLFAKTSPWLPDFF
ncbi:MAG: GNAT family N-acetyltransferase [Leptolyngbya sp. SIO4C5]|nr:GNAT family N-acetyltransferase [Leptolyngbya sp. SIO4C5]